MASSQEFLHFVCEQIVGVGDIRSKMMFGEYLVYIDEKPLLLICDNNVFVKVLPCLNELMKDAAKGYPYEGAKEHYILDIENRELALAVISRLAAVTLPSKPKKQK